MKRVYSVVFCFLILLACENKDIDENISVHKLNSEVILSYKKSLRSLGLKAEDYGDHNRKLFIQYFNNYSIKVNDEIVTIGLCDFLSAEELYPMVIKRLNEFDTNGLSFPRGQTNDENSRNKDKNKKPPSDEEIKDAFMKECATYSSIIAKICQAAVEIAYRIRKL